MTEDERAESRWRRYFRAGRQTPSPLRSPGRPAVVDDRVGQ